MASQQRILFINACGSCEGDVNVMLMTLANLPPDKFKVIAVSVPRGSVYEALSRMAHVTLLPLELGGSEVRTLGNRPELVETVTAIFSLVSLVRREKVDLIYSIDRTVAAYIATAVSRITGRPLGLLAAYPFYGTASWRNRIVLRHAKWVQVHSEYLRRYLQPFVRDEKRLRLIPDAINVKNYSLSVSGKTLRDELGISEEAPVVAMAGRIDPYKGHGTLIEAARIVLRERPDTHFIIAGRDGGILADLQAKVKSYELTNIHFVGYYPDLPALMMAGDIVTMPSDEEPFGLVALEGMAMAKPVVATRAGGVPEFLLHQQSGLLVPPKDPAALAGALLELINQPAWAADMGRWGRAHVEKNYDMPLFMQRVTDLLTNG